MTTPTPKQMNEAQVAEYSKWLDEEIKDYKDSRPYSHADNGRIIGIKDARVKFRSLLSSSSTTMTHTDVIKKLIGNTKPFGDSNIDEQRFQNLKELCEVVSDLIEEIKEARNDRFRQEASMKKMGIYADNFLIETFKNLEK